MGLMNSENPLGAFVGGNPAPGPKGGVFVWPGPLFSPPRSSSELVFGKGPSLLEWEDDRFNALRSASFMAFTGNGPGSMIKAENNFNCIWPYNSVEAASPVALTVLV